MKKTYISLALCFITGLPSQAILAVDPSVITPIIHFTLDSESKFQTTLRNYNNGLVDDYVYIAAHRGGKENDESDQAPGNSIANIDNAISKGFDIYESDIEVLLGGVDPVLVVFHDNDFNNLTNTQVNGTRDLLDNADLSYAKSLKLTYDSGVVSNESIPTLEEFLTAVKGRIIVKFDLKSGVFSPSVLLKVFELINQTNTNDQVLIRGGQFVLDTAYDNGFDASIVMPKLSTAPTNAELSVLKNKYNTKAISIPNGASAQDIANATNLGILVEVHEVQGNDAQARLDGWRTAINSGVRQFHSFKPIELKSYLDTTIHRTLN